jgi:hypothetical protein
MRKNTNELMIRSWDLLCRHPQLNDFASREDFEQEFRQIGEVAGDGEFSFFTRISAAKPFRDGNIQIVNIEHPRDEEKISVPFIGGRAG